jgi:hypothetical protein
MAAGARRRRPTWGLTDQTLTMALALLVALVTGAAVGGLSGRFRLVVLAIAGLCIAGAALGDGFVGLVAGLLAAAAYVELTRRYGTWGPGAFPLTALTSALLLLLGWNAGTSVAAVRGAAQRGAARPGVASPADRQADPLQPGLFTLAHGMLRLDEEVHRARSGGLPLGLLVVRTTVVDAALDSPARSSARRSVARVVVSRTRQTDIPFSSGHGEICAILPVTDPADAWGVLTRLLEGFDEAVFTDRAHDAIAPVKDFVEIETSLVFLGSGHATAAQLLGQAQASLREPPAPTDAGRR